MVCSPDIYCCSTFEKPCGGRSLAPSVRFTTCDAFLLESEQHFCEAFKCKLMCAFKRLTFKRKLYPSLCICKFVAKRIYSMCVHEAHMLHPLYIL